jgi:hypothetical protein
MIAEGAPVVALFVLTGVGYSLLYLAVERERLCKLTGEILGKHKEK